MDYEFLDDTYSVLKDTSLNEEEDWGMEENEVLLVKFELFTAYRQVWDDNNRLLNHANPYTKSRYLSIYSWSSLIIFHLCCSATR